ncbi:hypothetical protein, partial [Escherichia sp. E4385]|uniref:hypothetical protein n=1 Tax=Escherichia sp. E4385 TaxID=2040639 RepID=UPI00197ABE9D
CWSRTVGRVRRLRRIRQPLPDVTLARLIRPVLEQNCRSDKAFTPHPTMIARCRKGIKSRWR